eukprot:1523637-Rhodomonas_salina.1
MIRALRRARGWGGSRDRSGGRDGGGRDAGSQQPEQPHPAQRLRSVPASADPVFPCCVQLGKAR